MRQEDQLIEKYGKDTGYRVPEGYFEDLNSRIMANLPPYTETPRAVEMSLWQRMKPYVYLAAMFAGIWLMMSVFHNVADSGRISLDNPPETIASAMLLQSDDYAPYVSVENDYELEKEVSARYDSFDEFEADFDYNLKSEYESIELPATNIVSNTSKTVLI